MSVDLNSMTVKQLKELCKEQGKTKYSALRKQELIDLLSTQTPEPKKSKTKTIKKSKGKVDDEEELIAKFLAQQEKQNKETKMKEDDFYKRKDEAELPTLKLYKERLPPLEGAIFDFFTWGKDEERMKNLVPLILKFKGTEKQFRNVAEAAADMYCDWAKKHAHREISIGLMTFQTQKIDPEVHYCSKLQGAINTMLLPIYQIIKHPESESKRILKAIEPINAKKLKWATEKGFKNPTNFLHRLPSPTSALTSKTTKITKEHLLWINNIADLNDVLVRTKN